MVNRICHVIMKMLDFHLILPYVRFSEADFKFSLILVLRNASVLYGETRRFDHDFCSS
jgi:hypothetical protein